MSFVGRLLGLRSGPEDTLWLRQAFVAGASSSGITVNVDRAMHLDSVFAAVMLRSKALGALPLKVYRRDAAGDRTEAWREPVYELLHERPGPELSAINLLTLTETHLCTWGNGYWGKDIRGGRVVEVWPLYPERMESVERTGGRKVFRYRNERGQLDTYTSDELIHFMGPSLDGVTGISPIGYAREAIGAGLSAQVFAGSFFDNSAVPRGVLEVDGELNPDATARLRAAWEKAHRGRKNQNKVAVLEYGLKFKPITMPLEDAQFVEQEKLGVQKIARIFGIPPELIGGDSGTSLTYSTVEGQMLHFLTLGLSWELALIEQTLAGDRDLFPTREAGLYPEFLVDAMLRADMKTAAETDALALDPATGWMSRDEVRRRRNLPPDGITNRLPAAPAPEDTRDAMARVLAELAEARAAAHTNGGATHAHA